MKKERLDVVLVQQGQFASRERARRYIMTGDVLVNDVPVDKPGTKIDPAASIRLRRKPLAYVGRGGLKMEKALRVFPVSVTDKVVIDIGASTGGFTDCALRNGARKVYAVDVGYGQLAWKLRNSPQVVNMERTNIRHVTPTDIGEPAQLIVIDVSFISLTKVLPAAVPLLDPGGDLLVLIKPQFEAGKDLVGKGGIVRDPAVHRQVLTDFHDALPSFGLQAWGLTISPIKGSEGNIEFLAWLRTDASGVSALDYHQAVEHVLRIHPEEGL